MRPDMKTLIVDALKDRRGDDLEQFEDGVQGRDPSDEYGESGFTIEQIRSQLRTSRERYTEAIAYVMGL